jgi:hypothetical protein
MGTGHHASPGQDYRAVFLLYRWQKRLCDLRPWNAIVSDGLSDDDARKEATATLAKIFNYHPDMNPVKMDDGNILVQYNQPAYNVVLEEIGKKNMKTIEANHQKALARAEVLITPLGNNKFDEFGMKALFGRCYFFMDAKKPIVTKVVRKIKREPGGAPNAALPHR